MILESSNIFSIIEAQLVGLDHGHCIHSPGIFVGLPIIAERGSLNRMYCWGSE